MIQEDQIIQIYDHFNIEYRQTPNLFISQCHVHGGDNPRALNLYYNTNEIYRIQNWKCRTHKCEEKWGKTIFGLVRGLLSFRENRRIGVAETKNFLKKFVDVEIGVENQEKLTFVNSIGLLDSISLQESDEKCHVEIPSKYFLGRGFAAETLNQYAVGDCLQSTNKMFNRAVVPCFDKNGLYMGASGRSLNGCKPKWFHSFKKNTFLYNLNRAYEFINRTHICILVESPANVWKLEECGVHNSVCLFGTNLNTYHKKLIFETGTMCLITLLDNDKAGQNAAKKIQKDLQEIYYVYNVIPPLNDVAEMSQEDIQQRILPEIKRMELLYAS